MSTQQTNVVENTVTATIVSSFTETSTATETETATATETQLAQSTGLSDCLGQVSVSRCLLT